MMNIEVSWKDGDSLEPSKTHQILSGLRQLEARELRQNTNQ